VSGFAQSEQTPAAWKTAIDQHKEYLLAKNGEGTDAELKQQLLEMRDADQHARGISFQGQAPVKGETMEQLRASDAKRSEALKQIVQQKGWPTLALVGWDASDGAMMLLTHTADRDWRKQLLPQLQELAKAGKIDPAPLSFLVDKELVAEGKQQRYGTQFMYIGGKVSMYAVEDPARLDERRSEAMLPPISVYKEQMAKMYHLEVSDDVVMAPAPAKK
jgi:hypothetical protein